MPSLTAGSTPEVKEGQQRDIQRPILCRVQKVSHINDSFLLGKVANGSRLIYGQKDGQTDRNLSRVLRSRKERPMFLHLRRPPIYSTDTFATTSLWLDRTQWPSLYRGPRRDVLRALTRLPDRYSLSADYTLGQGTLEGTPNLISPREDEQKISCIVRALDSVIGRCEDTVRCTSHNLLCWLLSSRLRSRREFTFNLVAERSSEGTWPVVERQGSSLVGTHSSPIGGQSIDDSLNTRTREELDVKERAEDGEVDKENVEAWELEDDESDYNDSGYYTDIDGSTAGTHQDLFSGVSGDSATSACN
uniref:Uncharacterized protein n=1 Tax=Fusarium oxysporum (strain Fo5176) TaxID=660025 RepID=A0A0D2XSY0_FUSOF